MSPSRTAVRITFGKEAREKGKEDLMARRELDEHFYMSLYE